MFTVFKMMTTKNRQLLTSIARNYVVLFPENNTKKYKICKKKNSNRIKYLTHDEKVALCNALEQHAKSCEEYSFGVRSPFIKKE